MGPEQGEVIGGDDRGVDPAVAAFRRSTLRDLQPHLDARAPAPTGGVIVLEMTSIASAQTAHAYLATALACEEDARVIAYRFGRRPGWRARIRELLGGSWSQHPRLDGLEEVYRSFSDEVRVITPSRAEHRQAERRVRTFLAGAPTLVDLERYEVDGAMVGDLILDKHVQRGNPVIRIEHPGIRSLLLTMTANALALHRVFSRLDVRAVISSGLAVAPGLPLRVALSRGVRAYPATFDYVWRLTPERPNWSREYEEHRQRFAELDQDEAHAARAAAERFLRESLASEGEGSNNLGSTAAWARRSAPEGVLPSGWEGRRKIVVAAHSFSDSPHSVGSTLFPDFFSWLEHLAGLVDRTDYLWLFKLHPDERDEYIGVLPEVERLLHGKENARIIPSDLSHWALIEYGIDLAVTIYGSIAVEYPALGIPAIVAWPDGFVSGYDFALRPTSVEELDELLHDPEAWRYPIPREDLLEFVYCHYLWPRRPGVFQRVPAIASHGDDGGDFKKADFHLLWASRVTPSEAAEVLQVHREWIRSGTYSRNRFDQEEPRQPPAGSTGT